MGGDGDLYCCISAFLFQKISRMAVVTFNYDPAQATPPDMNGIIQRGT